MTTTTLPTITHRITYDATTRDYACYVSVGGDPEQYVGSADNHHAGELKCLAYRRDLLESDLVIPATTLDGQCSDCGQALDSMGLCGCRAEEPPAYTISEPQPCAGLQENCRYYEVIVNGDRFRLHNEWPLGIDVGEQRLGLPDIWVGRDLGEDPPTGLPSGALVKLRAMWERLFAPTPEGTAPYDNEELAHWWAKDQEVFALKLMTLTEPQLVLQATTFTAHINDRAYKSILLPGIQAETTLRVWRSIIAKASPPIEPPPGVPYRQLVA